ncbi:hypothetical protein ACFTAO_01225 [Paenibacillus rhizoplanae]
MQREALRREATLRLKEAARLLPQAASTQELGTGLLDMIMGMPFFPSSVLVFFEEQPGGIPTTPRGGGRRRLRLMSRTSSPGTPRRPFSLLRSSTGRRRGRFCSNVR